MDKLTPGAVVALAMALDSSISDLKGALRYFGKLSEQYATLDIERQKAVSTGSDLLSDLQSALADLSASSDEVRSSIVLTPSLTVKAGFSAEDVFYLVGHHPYVSVFANAPTSGERSFIVVLCCGDEDVITVDAVQVMALSATEVQFVGLYMSQWANCSLALPNASGDIYVHGSGANLFPANTLIISGSIEGENQLHLSIVPSSGDGALLQTDRLAACFLVQSAGTCLLRTPQPATPRFSSRAGSYLGSLCFYAAPKDWKSGSPTFADPDFELPPFQSLTTLALGKPFSEALLVYLSQEADGFDISCVKADASTLKSRSKAERAKARAGISDDSPQEKVLSADSATRPAVSVDASAGYPLLGTSCMSHSIAALATICVAFGKSEVRFGVPPTLFGNQKGSINITLKTN